MKSLQCFVSVLCLLLLSLTSCQTQDSQFSVPSQPVVESMSIGAGGSVDVTLTWEPVETFGNIEQYLVQGDLAADKSFSTVQVTESTIRSAVITGLTAGQVHRFRIGALVDGTPTPFGPHTEQLIIGVSRVFPVGAYVTTQGNATTSITVKGKGFKAARSYKLRLTSSTGTTVVSAKETDILDGIVGAAPLGQNPIVYNVSMSTDNGVTFVNTGTVPKTFQLYQPFSVSNVVPRSGSASSMLTITGSNFVSTGDISCRFDNTLTAAIVVSPTELRCVAPAPTHTSRLDVTLNQMDFQGGLDYTYSGGVRVSSLSPVTGPARGGVQVTLIGTGFANTGSIKCRFDLIEVTGQFLSSTQVVCPSPPTVVGVTIVEVSLAGNVYTNSLQKYTVFETPIVTDVTPTTSTRDGGQVVTVTGTNFFDTTNAFCRLSTLVPVTFVNSTFATCTTPAMSSGQYEFAVTFGGNIFFGTRQFIVANDGEVSIFQVIPVSGPALGGTVVTFAGSGFQQSDASASTPTENTNTTRLLQTASAFECVFPSSTDPVPAVVVSKNVLTCRVPPDGAQHESVTAAHDINVVVRQTSPVSASIGTESFTYYKSPTVTGVLPKQTQSLFKQTVVTVFGSFPAESTLTAYCKFDPEGEVAVTASKHTASSIECVPPLSSKTSTNPIAVSFNAVDYHWNQNVLFSFSECPQGQVAASGGSCEKCPAGTSRNKGELACTACDNKSYASVPGSPVCTPCPKNTLSLDPTSLGGCQCERSFFTSLGTAGVPCEPCPEGAECPGSIRLPVPQPGWWSSASDPTVLIKCSPDDSCPGGEGSPCAEGYDAFACGSCAPGFFRQNGVCNACSSNSKIYLVLFATLFIVIVCAIVYNVGGAHSTRFMSVLEIVSSFAQIMSIVVAFNLNWPSLVGDTVTYSTAVFTFNLDFLASECTMPMSYFRKFLLSMLIPFLVLVIFGVIQTLVILQNWMARRMSSNPRLRRIADTDVSDAGFGARMKNRMAKFLTMPVITERQMIAQLINSFILILGLAYLFLTSGAVAIFQCSQQQGGTYTLDGQPSILCYSGEWWHYVPAAIFFIILYGLGIPILMVVLFSSKKSNHHSFLLKFGSHVDRFRRSHATWETHLLARKALIAVCELLFSSYVLFRAIFVLLVLFVSLAEHNKARPFNEEMFNELESVLLWVCALVLSAGMCFFAGQFPNQVARTVLEFATLTVIAVAAIFVLIIILQSLSHAAKVHKAEKAWNRETKEKVHPVCEVLNNELLPITRAWVEQEDTGAYNKKYLTLLCSQILEVKQDQEADEVRHLRDGIRYVLPHEESTGRLRPFFNSYCKNWFNINMEYYVINYCIGSGDDMDSARGRYLVNAIRSLEQFRVAEEAKRKSAWQWFVSIFFFWAKRHQSDPTKYSLTDQENHETRQDSLLNILVGDVVRTRLAGALKSAASEKGVKDSDYDNSIVHKFLSNMTAVAPVDGGFSGTRKHDKDLSEEQAEQAALLESLRTEIRDELMQSLPAKTTTVVKRMGGRMGGQLPAVREAASIPPFGAKMSLSKTSLTTTQNGRGDQDAGFLEDVESIDIGSDEESSEEEELTTVVTAQGSRTQLPDLHLDLSAAQMPKGSAHPGMNYVNKQDVNQIAGFLEEFTNPKPVPPQHNGGDHPRTALSRASMVSNGQVLLEYEDGDDVSELSDGSIAF